MNTQKVSTLEICRFLVLKSHPLHNPYSRAPRNCGLIRKPHIWKQKKLEVFRNDYIPVVARGKSSHVQGIVHGQLCFARPNNLGGAPSLVLKEESTVYGNYQMPLATPNGVSSPHWKIEHPARKAQSLHRGTFSEEIVYPQIYWIRIIFPIKIAIQSDTHFQTNPLRYALDYPSPKRAENDSESFSRVPGCSNFFLGPPKKRGCSQGSREP